MAKPQKSKAEFSLDHVAFGTLLPFCAAIPFEVLGLGVVSFAKLNARIKASLKNPNSLEACIEFSLVKENEDLIKKPLFFGDVNAHVIDEDLKLYLIAPHITQSEAEAILKFFLLTPFRTLSKRIPTNVLCSLQIRYRFFLFG